MNKLLVTIFVIAFVFRILLIFVGYHGDLNNQISWGNAIYQYGPVDIYEKETWDFSTPNQPPLTLLLLGAMSALWDLIHKTSWYLNDTVSFFPSSFIWFWEQRGIVLLMKLPSIVADILIGYFIYRYLKLNRLSVNKSTSIAAVWLFNPIVWYNSSIWGQTDSVVNLLGLLSVFALISKKLKIAVFWFTLCILFKGSLAYFTPILVTLALLQKYNLKDYIVSFIYFLFTVVIVSISFHPQIDLFSWLYHLYIYRFIPGEIGYLTANAFNFWWIVDSGKTLDSTVFFGFPSRVWGYVLPIIIIVLSIGSLMKKISDKKVFTIIAVLSFTIFLFMTRIHERYLYPFFPYATLMLAFIPRLWIFYIIISIIHLLNLYNLFWVPSFVLLEGIFAFNSFGIILSVISIATYIFILRQATNQKDIMN